MTEPITFEDFYALYPRKVGKGQARKSWCAAVKKLAAAHIIAALDLQIRAGVFHGMMEDARRRGMPDKQLIPHPSTWLTGERWDDEIVPRSRPVYRNAALELLARDAEAGLTIEAERGDLLEGPSRG